MSEHGTRSRYVDGCRCEACTKANSDYSRRYSAKLKEERGEASHAYAPHQLVDGTRTREVVEHLVERYGRRKAAQLLRWDLKRLDNFRSHPSKKVRYETARSVMDFMERVYRAHEKAMKLKTWEDLKKEREAAGFVVNPYE